MSTRPRPKKTENSISTSEWLAVIASLDELMAKQASHESIKAQKPVLEKSTLAAVNTAYKATLRYYTALLAGGKRDERAQGEISRLWQNAGVGLRQHDPDLAKRLKASNGFWVHDLTWENETIQQAWAGLNSIRISANALSLDVKMAYRWSTFASSSI